MKRKIESAPVPNKGQYRGWQKFNGRYYYLYNGEKYYSKGTKRLHRVVWEYYRGRIPKGYDVHHKDENRRNNNISNLELRKAGAHRSVHLEAWHAKPENKKKTIEHLNRVRIDNRNKK